MTVLLRLNLAIDPDRFRFARFVMDAANALECNMFACATVVSKVMAMLHDDLGRGDVPISLSLCVQANTLLCEWGNGREILALLHKTPEKSFLGKLADNLRLASESADIDLLINRNKKIEAELEKAKQSAEDELASLTEKLEHKKAELLATIRLAERDSLTGLYNRGAYDERLHEAVMRCLRQCGAFSLILMDLDYFKQINDTYGHQYGDEYLKKMADVMQDSIRDHVDVACRMGGDEFAILAYADLAGARAIAERVLQGMEGKTSIGIAQLTDSDNPESLVARADTSLYEAKRQGRGRICTSLDLTSV